MAHLRRAQRPRTAVALRNGLVKLGPDFKTPLFVAPNIFKPTN
jgi:hypothetical protein